MRVKLQIGVAAMLLLLLGYVYGAHKDTLHAGNCSPSKKIIATLSKKVSLDSSQARYVFTGEDGCRILVYASRFPVLITGTKAEIIGKQVTPQIAFVGLPEYAEYLISDGIAFVVRNSEVVVLEEGRASLDTFRVAVASRIALLFREPDSSLITAMLTGDQGMIPKNIQEIYRSSGITHILSISGLHVSIIAVVLTGCIGLLRVSPPIRTLLIFALLWMYICSVGSPASAVRAGFFWTCFVFAYHVRALVGMLTVILVTLACLLTYSPNIAGAIGFQLSVVAVCGIGVSLFFIRQVRMSALVQGVVTLFAVSVGATIATAPLTLYYFGNVSVVGIITNVLVVPLLPLITYLVLVALFLQPFFVPLALACSFVVHLLFSWILFVASICASIPYGHFEGIEFSIRGIVLYYSGILIAIILYMHWKKISWRQWWI